MADATTTDPIDVDLSVFLPVLTFIAGFTNDRDIVEAGRYIFFHEGSLRAMSGSTGAIATLPFTMSRSFGIPAVRFLPSIERLVAQQRMKAQFSFSRSELIVTAGRGHRARYPLWIDDTDAGYDFSMRPVPDSSQRKKFPDGFWATVKRVAFAASSNEQTPHLTGVYVSPEGGVMAADGLRVAHCLASGLSPKVGVTLPGHLLKRIPADRQAVAYAIEKDAICWMFFDDGIAAYGLIPELEFPYSAVMGIVASLRRKRKEKGHTTIAVNEPLQRAMDTVLPTSLPPMHQVVLRVRPKMVEVDVPKEYGIDHDITDQARTDVDGPAITISVPGQLFHEMNQHAAWWLISADSSPLYAVSEDKTMEMFLVRIMSDTDQNA